MYMYTTKKYCFIQFYITVSSKPESACYKYIYIHIDFDRHYNL